MADGVRDNLTYEEVFDIRCPICGQLLNWQDDEFDMLKAHCCGHSYTACPTKYTVQIEPNT